MSAAAQPRNLTQGWAKIPVSMIENQVALTRGELALALIVHRRGGEGVTVSDQNWSAWTGLSPRMKEYSIKGLQSKGLRMEGQGEKARYGWDSQVWEKYVRQANPQEIKARTAGRAVEPKPGSKVHPECRDKGCAMLRAECASGLTLLSATQVAQPVAQNPETQGTNEAVKSSLSNSGLSLVSATQAAQPVARKQAKETEIPAESTLRILQTIFPIIGVAFLLQLIKAVGKIFGHVSDEELSRAVEYAWAHHGRRQKSPGLFLVTVPEAIAALRRAPPPTLDRDPLREHLRRILAALDAKEGQLYQRTAERIRALGDIANSDIEAFEAGLIAAEDSFSASAKVVLGLNMAPIDEKASKALGQHKNLALPQQIELRRNYERAFLFEALNLPRFTVFE